MNHQAVQIFYPEMLKKRYFQTYVLVIAVAVDSYYGFEGRNFLKSTDVSPVTAVEDDIHVIEEILQVTSKVSAQSFS